MTPEPTHELEALLAHAGWMRGLARGLARDPGAADDAVQDTWLAALEHAPPAGAPVRAWLATVVRNFALQRRRADARRVRREELGARPLAVQSAHDVAAGLALQQELAQRVLALAEPYRSTIYQRYYEGLAPREIAARAGVPVKTVKTRLARGLAQLRTELDTSHGGDRAAWLSALVPFVGREQAAALYLGAVVMNLKLAFVLAGLALCAVVSLAIWQRAPESAARSNAVSSVDARAELVAPAGERSELAHDATEAGRKDAAAVVVPESAAAPTVSRRPRISGRVLDVAGRPVADVDVARVERDETPAGNSGETRRPLARTAADGSFELDTTSGAMTLDVEHPRWSTVCRAYHTAGQDYARATIVVAPRNALAGLVVGTDGATVADAELWIDASDAWSRELGIALDNTLPVYWKTTSDARGRFALPNAPRMPGKLVVRSPLHQPFEMELPDAPAADLVLTLAPLERPHVLITGTVVNAENEPVAGAHVAVGNRYVLTAADGAFRFDLTDRMSGGNVQKLENGVWVPDDDRTELRAVKAGALPARHTLPPFDELERETPAPIVLRLGGAPLTIRGRVLDEDGAPIAGVDVEFGSLTPFGQKRSEDGRGGMTWGLDFETLMRGEETGAQSAPTNERGEFEITGLLDRSYDLTVHDANTLRRVRLDGVRAGASAVELRLPAAKGLVRVAGRVAGKNGEPIAGVDVRAGYEVPGSFARLTKAVRTDERGHFEFTALATEGLGFQVIGERIFIVFWRAVKPGEDVGALELVASRRAFVQLDLTGRAGFADHFSAVDAHGEACRMMQFEGPAIFFPERAEIDAEKSAVVAVEEDTRTIVLWNEDKEVARVPVNVVAEETVVVRP